MAQALRPDPSGAGKREAILAAACELFSRRGFDGTPVPEIAARAGVGTGTLYRYFPSKQSLGNALYRQCKLELGRCLAEEPRPGLAPREEFAAIWRGLRHFATARPDAFRFLELHHHEEMLDAESRALSDEVFARIVAFVRGAQAAGSVRPGDPALLISLAFGAFTGLVKEGCASRFGLDDHAFDRAEEAVWALLSAQETRENSA